MPRVLIAIVSIALSLGLTAPQAHAQATVDEALAGAVSDGDLAGAVAVVRDATGVTRFSAGHADVDAKTGFAPDTHVRAASITKTFVAATLLQLVAEGTVNLDASIATYLPGRIHGAGIDADAITVRQLLRHQSGLPEYFAATSDVPTQPATGDQLLDMALTRPAQFPPGTQMAYTNTNYVVAGLLIQAVTGNPPEAEITRRIIAPLSLGGTYFPALGDFGLRAPFAHGYEVEDGRRVDVTQFNASAAGLAGSMVTTDEDATTFVTALLDGRVVPRPQLDAMMQTVPWPGNEGFMDYGLGLMKVTLACGVTVWGHGGDIEGYHSFVAKSLDGPAVAVTFTQEPAAESLAQDPRGDVMAAALCP